MNDTSIAALIGTQACIAGLRTLVGKVVDATADKLGREVKKFQARNDIEHLYEKMSVVRKVKTLLSLEESLDLADFYYPTSVTTQSISVQGTVAPHIVSDMDDFFCENRILVQGTVGQGKSIFLRYLCAREMTKGETLPIFLELRKIRSTQTLTEALVAEANSYGFDLDDDVFEHLLAHGKVTLLLDGFDEVAESRRVELLNQIDAVCKRHSSVAIVLSSRPGTGAEGSSFFNVRQVAEIDSDDYPDVIRRFVDDGERVDSLIDGVEESSVRTLLTSPLMIALLVVRFRINGTVPENEISFFDDLFPLLLHRHDTYKGGYGRERKSKLGDHALRKIFCGICYFSKKADSNFRYSDLCKWAERSLRVEQYPEGAVADVIADITQITNLILEESGECRFVHKSIQEYHAAVFIAGQSNEKAHKFYSAFARLDEANAVRSLRTWLEELVYLGGLDRLRFVEYFLIPEISKLLIGAPHGPTELSRAFFPRVVFWELLLKKPLPSGLTILVAKSRLLCIDILVTLTERESITAVHSVHPKMWLLGQTRVQGEIVAAVRNKHKELVDYVKAEKATIDMFDPLADHDDEELEA